MREIVVARCERYAVAVTLFAEGRKEETQKRRKIFFDVRRDHALERRPRLDALHAPVESGERDDVLDAVFAERQLELAIRVGRIQRRHDGANLPRAELRDHELRAVRHQERNTIAATNSERRERRRAGVAQTVELGVCGFRSLEKERRLIRVIARREGDVIEDRAVRVGRERRRDALVVMSEPRRCRIHQRRNSNTPSTLRGVG